jgi:hypothetical protein
MVICQNKLLRCVLVAFGVTLQLCTDGSETSMPCCACCAVECSQADYGIVNGQNKLLRPVLCQHMVWHCKLARIALKQMSRPAMLCVLCCGMLAGGLWNCHRSEQAAAACVGSIWGNSAAALLSQPHQQQQQ